MTDGPAPSAGVGFARRIEQPGTQTKSAIPVMDKSERAQRAAEVLTRQRYGDVAEFVEAYYGQDVIIKEDLRRTLQDVELQAQGHTAEYAAGMREASRILEVALLGTEADE